jgi:RNA polymerase sigma factor (sigma-70 family)
VAVAHSEQELIQDCRRGKARAQEGLYRHFYAFGMSVCLRYASCREDALEVLNDSFMKVFQHIESFDTARPFKSWFRRILVNTALDHYRMNQKYRLHQPVDEDLDLPGVEPEFNRKMSAEEILDLFAGIPEKYRIIFNLYEVEGYSHDEIAGLLDISPGTSRSHLSRAKKMLQRLYFEKQNNECHEAV